ncbi:hypothetical protein JW930_05390 [Candidatus Woesearchaeota archaeon]|nr:hypothetical protein [Candidatus Woesearchaeota archaeon]
MLNLLYLVLVLGVLIMILQVKIYGLLEKRFPKIYKQLGEPSLWRSRAFKMPLVFLSRKLEFPKNKMLTMYVILLRIFIILFLFAAGIALILLFTTPFRAIF